MAFARQVVVVLALGALALFLWKILPVLLLAFAGIVFASAIRAGADPLTRRLHVPQTLSVAIVVLAALALLAAGGYFFGHQLAKQAQELFDAIRASAGKVQEYVQRLPMGDTVVANLHDAASGDAVSKAVKGTFTVFGALGDVLLVFFVAVYVSVNPHLYVRAFLALLPAHHREPVGEALEASGIALRRWLLGQLAAMLMVGSVTAIGLWLVGVPLALPLGILMGLLDFVPIIGPIAAAIPGVLIAFSQSPQLALYAALVYLTVQFLEGHLVIPLAQRWAVALPPALPLLGIVAFGLVFGPMGVLFAMPLLVVTVVLVQKLYVSRLEAVKTTTPAAGPER